MPKPKRATWWKMLYHQRAVIESIQSAEVGMGLKAAFRYFDGEEIDKDNLSPQAFTVFCVMKPYIDESMRSYETSVMNGKRGARERWGSDSPSIDSL